MDYADLPPAVTDHKYIPHRRLHRRHGAKNLPKHRVEKEMNNIPASPPNAQPSVDADEGRALARSEMPLPRQGVPLARARTLGHRGFVRTPSKGKVRIKQAATTEDAQVAQLYHTGALYDNHEKNVFEVFNLNSIQHEEPIYSIRYGKRPRQTHELAGVVSNPLHLDLSFSDLSDDDAIAQWFAPPLSASQSPGHETTQASLPPPPTTIPLKVVYELADSSSDIPASQPPELVMDALSDFDHLDKSEVLEEDVAQEEVLEGVDNTSCNDAWVLVD